MDETSGTTAIDGSGFNHPGTLVNGATRVAGKYGQAVRLNGSNQYINIADHNDYTLNPFQSYTWSAWVKNNNFNQWSTVWSQTVSSSNFFYFYAHTSNDNEAGPVTNGVSVYWYSNGNNKAIIRTIPITLTITDAASIWTVSVIGSTGVPNNTVRVGKLKDDGLERIYVGTIATGRMLEYSWNGASWNGPVDVGGSPSGAEIHNCTIGPGRKGEIIKVDKMLCY